MRIALVSLLGVLLLQPVVVAQDEDGPVMLGRAPGPVASGAVVRIDGEPRPAPGLTLTGLLQAPAGMPGADELSWGYFQERGHVVVLEFWATWCGPCIAAIPHLNALGDEFKNQPVTFLSVTSESEEVVRPFLEKREMRSWIGVDTSKAMQKAFGVRGIPHTVLIDKQGRIAGITHPDSLTSEHIQRLIAGQATGLPTESPRPVAMSEPAKGAKPILEIVITPLEEDDGWRLVSAGPGGMKKTTGLLGMLIDAYGFYNRPRIVLPDEWDDGLYSITMQYPREREVEAVELLRQIIRTTFGISARTEVREADVLLLTAPKGPGEGLVATGAGSSAARGSRGQWTAFNQPIESIATRLESTLKKIVIDESGLDGLYDFELNWDQDDPESLARIVKTKLGLTLTPARREIEFLIVERLGVGADAAEAPAAANAEP